VKLQIEGIEVMLCTRWYAVHRIPFWFYPFFAWGSSDLMSGIFRSDSSPIVYPVVCEVSEYNFSSETGYESMASA
jgi:hypothetical protein